MEPIKLTDSEGHLILACKGWYDVEGVTMFDTLGRLFAGFCGWSAVEHGIPMEGLSDRLYKTLIKCGKDPVQLQSNLHRWLASGWWSMGEESSKWNTFEKIVCFYRSEFVSLAINDNGKPLILLPKPQKRAAKTLIRGKAEYTLKLMDKLTTD